MKEPDYQEWEEVVASYNLDEKYPPCGHEEGDCECMSNLELVQYVGISARPVWDVIPYQTNNASSWLEWRLDGKPYDDDALAKMIGYRFATIREHVMEDYKKKQEYESAI